MPVIHYMATPETQALTRDSETTKFKGFYQNLGTVRRYNVIYRSNYMKEGDSRAEHNVSVWDWGGVMLVLIVRVRG